MSEESLVRDVVDAYVRSTYEGDVDGMRGVFWPDATMNGYLDGKLLAGSPEPFFDSLASMPSLKSSGAPYESHVANVSVAGNVASVTLKETGFGPFAFTNYLHLIRRDGTWKIISKTFTSE